jgi:oligopeptide/dipeptide ABC transporter ATP-binding protein
MATEPLLRVRELSIVFDTRSGPVRVVDGVSFEVHPHEAVCIVGESGSGKSVTMLAVMGLLPRNGRVVEGEICFKGQDLRQLSDVELRGIRGRQLAMVFQDPMTSLNPVHSVGRQLDEMIRIHRPDLSRAEVRRRSVELLSQVHIPNPEARHGAYPHQFSGGMRQRAMIAMSMAHNPALLIADEPTTALDVTIQAQVLALLREMRERTHSAMVLITHDLGVVAETADRVVVMYGGRVAEAGPVEELFNRPRHPYTVGLMASRLRVDAASDAAYAIPGSPATPANRPPGCAFHPRCGLSGGRTGCAETVPGPARVGPGHVAACHFSEETPAWMAENFSHLLETASAQ